MSAGAARLFVALDLPGDAARQLAAWGAAAAADPALRPLPEASLHLTLHFLGERPAGDIPALSKAVTDCGAAATGPIVLASAGAVALPPGRPRVLALRLACGDERLDGLHDTLGAALEHAAAGWRRERRPLLAHVSVARVRGGRRPGEDAPGAPSLGPFAAPSLSLQRSHAGEPGGGPRYETLARADLPGS